MKPLHIILGILGIVHCAVTPSPLKNMYFPEYENPAAVTDQANADTLTNTTIGGYQCIRAGMAFAVA